MADDGEVWLDVVRGREILQRSWLEAQTPRENVQFLKNPHHEGTDLDVWNSGVVCDKHCIGLWVDVRLHSLDERLAT